jgi:hypothetical protein
MTESDTATDPVPALRLDHALVGDQLRQALADRATRLGLDPTSIASPSPHAITARAVDGTLLRLDYGTYSAPDLER